MSNAIWGRTDPNSTTSADDFWSGFISRDAHRKLDHYRDDSSRSVNSLKLKLTIMSNCEQLHFYSQGAHHTDSSFGSDWHVTELGMKSRYDESQFLGIEKNRRKSNQFKINIIVMKNFPHGERDFYWHSRYESHRFDGTVT